MDTGAYDENVKTAAREAVLAARAVRPCPRHPHLMIRLGDEKAEHYAYALATTALKRERAIDARQDIMDAIKDELDSAVAECPECARQRST